MAVPKEILDISAYAGQVILINGGEVYRVENTISYICEAYGINDSHSLVTPTGIFVTIDDGSKNAHTIVKRIHNREVNLNKISQINDLSHNLKDESLSYGQAMKKLTKINAQSNQYSLVLTIIMACLASAANVVLMNKSLLNIIPAILASLSAQLLVNSGKILKDKMSFVSDLAAGFITGSLSLFMFQRGLGTDLSIIIVSALLPFVPGVALTNAIRDAINKDLISSASRAIETGLVAINLAIGVAIALRVFQ